MCLQAISTFLMSFLTAAEMSCWNTCFVTTADRNRKHSKFCFQNIPGSVSKAILRRAGSEMQLECTNNPVLRSKHIRVTKGWNLFCEYVIHVKTPRSVDKLAERIKKALDDAELIGVGSVALPTLGAGLLKKINLHCFISPWVLHRCSIFQVGLDWTQRMLLEPWGKPSFFFPKVHLFESRPLKLLSTNNLCCLRLEEASSPVKVRVNQSFGSSCRVPKIVFDCKDSWIEK